MTDVTILAIIEDSFDEIVENLKEITYIIHRCIEYKENKNNIYNINDLHDKINKICKETDNLKIIYTRINKLL